jgi:hypothetical protein
LNQKYQKYQKLEILGNLNIDSVSVRKLLFDVGTCLCTTSSTSTTSAKSYSRMGNEIIGESNKITEGFEKTKNRAWEIV